MRERASGSILVEIDGEEKLLAIPEFEALVGAAFIPQLDFEDGSAIQTVGDHMDRLQEQGKLTAQQLWMGTTYRKEIESFFFPDVILRWIDPHIGWGVFANRPFQRMEFIGEYSGKVRKRWTSDNAYCMEYLAAAGIPTAYMIDARDQGGIARFINHSYTPNLLTALATVDRINHVILIVNEPIAKGAQFFYNYNAVWWKERH